MFAVIAHGEVTCGRIACSVVNAAPAFALANATRPADQLAARVGRELPELRAVEAGGVGAEREHVTHRVQCRGYRVGRVVVQGVEHEGQGLLRSGGQAAQPGPGRQ